MFQTIESYNVTKKIIQKINTLILYLILIKNASTKCGKNEMVLSPILSRDLWVHTGHSPQYHYITVTLSGCLNSLVHEIQFCSSHLQGQEQINVCLC